MNNLGEGYKYVNMILNKGQKSGYVSPTEFNDAITAAHEELYAEARSYYEKTSSLTDDAYAVIATKGDAGDIDNLSPNASGMIALPEDYRYYASMSWLKTVNVSGCESKRVKVPVEKLTEAAWNTRIHSLLKGPEDNYPICCIRNSKIEVAPFKTTRRYALTYWKEVPNPYFDYILSNSAITYLAPDQTHDGTNPDPSISNGDPSRSVEIVWPESSRFYKKVLRIISVMKRIDIGYQEAAIEMQKQDKEWS